jgi:uridine kinase
MPLRGNDGWEAGTLIDMDEVVALLRDRPQGLVAIDGLPVSGKSTLADRLEAELDTRILYLDDFVLPESQWRGVARPAFPFPYMRYDEFSQAVMALARGEAARYRRYDWAAGRLADSWTEIEPKGLTVIEGVSTLNPELAPLYDLRLWVESDAASTLAASLARGVGDWEREWRELFMPSVERYMQSQPQSRADYRVKGRGVA